MNELIDACEQASEDVAGTWEVEGDRIEGALQMKTRRKPSIWQKFN